MLVKSVSTVLSIATFVALVGSAWAVPPSPEAKQKFIEEGTWDQKVANLKAFEESQPADMYETSRALHLDRFRARTALGPDAVDTVRICVLMVEFPDFKHDDTSYHIPGGGVLNCRAVGTPAMFDSLLFSVRGQDAVYNPTGSMTDYYLETSYGQYFIQGDVYGWFTVPQDYHVYDTLGGRTDGLGLGGSTLAHDAVIAADDAGVDFSPYGDGNNIVRGIIVIHAGPGAEQGAYGIWSHRSGMTPGVARDGVYLGGYTMQPEERFNENSIVHMGVFSHEWGHVIGAPDWYDFAYNPGSEGLGSWSIMASGSWNDGGRLPSHFDCWSKYLIGFGQMQFLAQNIINAPIPQAETSPISYALKDNPIPGAGSIEMWFVENRQRVGFDEALPGSGLLIYHFDGTMPNDTIPSRYGLAIEEADGRRDLAFNGSSGQNSDPFPGYGVNNRLFHDYSVPNSRTNDGVISQVSVLNITDSDSIMHADLGVYYAIPWLVLSGDSLTISDASPGGNGNGVFEQGETLAIRLEVRNQMKQTFWPTLHLDLDNADLQISNNDSYMGTALNPIYNNVNSTPIRVQVPSDFLSSRVNFKFAVVSDSNISTHDRKFRNTFEFGIPVGRPQILLVDDDGGFRGDDYYYTQALDRLGLPYVRWDKKNSGSPSYQSLSQYPNVLWMTGSYYPPTYTGGTLTAADVTYMKALLNNGGNLLLGSFTAPGTLDVLDSAFMADYLHANLTGSTSTYKTYVGDTTNSIFNGLTVQLGNSIAWNKVTPTLEATNSGKAAFTITGFGTGNYGTSGVTYDGTYRTVFLSFTVELLADNMPDIAPKDSLIMRALNFFRRGSSTGIDDEPGGSLLPGKFALEQNYPNPFNPSTTILYSIAPGDPVPTNLAIFNVLGQKVATLVDQVQGAGSYSVTWEGKDDYGTKVASGVYLYRLVHGGQAEAKKMMLLK